MRKIIIIVNDDNPDLTDLNLEASEEFTLPELIGVLEIAKNNLLRDTLQDQNIKFN